MENLRIVPLDDVVVFPGMPVTLPVDVGTDTHVLLLPRHDDTYAGIGVVAEVSERVRVGRGTVVALMPLYRAAPGRGTSGPPGRRHSMSRLGHAAGAGPATRGPTALR